MAPACQNCKRMCTRISLTSRASLSVEKTRTSASSFVKRSTLLRAFPTVVPGSQPHMTSTTFFTSSSLWILKTASAALKSTPLARLKSRMRKRIGVRFQLAASSSSRIFASTLTTVPKKRNDCSFMTRVCVPIFRRKALCRGWRRTVDLQERFSISCAPVPKVYTHVAVVPLMIARIGCLCEDTTTKETQAATTVPKTLASKTFQANSETAHSQLRCLPQNRNRSSPQ